MLPFGERVAYFCEKLVHQAGEEDGALTVAELRRGRARLALHKMKSGTCTYNTREFGALCGAVVKGAAHSGGDCVWPLES